MQLIKSNQVKQPLIDDLFPLFKSHLRILHDVEDDMIKLYLEGAIEAIGTFGGNDIFLTSYDVFYNGDYKELRYPSRFDGWYCGKWYVSNVAIFNPSGIDVTTNYVIDAELGMFYPHPMGDKITFDVGYATGSDIPAMLTTIIFRYAAHLFENRESIRVGEPKLIPDWVQYVMASVWKPRC